MSISHLHTSHYKLMFSRFSSCFLRFSKNTPHMWWVLWTKVTFISGYAAAGIEFGSVFSKNYRSPMIALVDIHIFSLTVYPPMSHWVYALTFLRSTSQGVDAVSRSFTGSLPLRCVVRRLLRCFRCLSCQQVNKRYCRGSCFPWFYAANCCSWACRTGPITSMALYALFFVPRV